jgi:hypothetical protein
MAKKKNSDVIVFKKKAVAPVLLVATVLISFLIHLLSLVIA